MMLKLRAVQAEFGDCLLVLFGDASQPQCLLVDGGPPDTFDNHLRCALQNLPGKTLELVVLSHVDNDHVIGLLDLFAELESQRAANQPPLVEVKALWHNAFSQTIGKGKDVEADLRSLVATAGTKNVANAGCALMGIGEGSRLRGLAAQLGVPVNQGFSEDVVSPESTPRPIPFGPLKVTVVGPTRSNLKQLQDEWEQWLDSSAGSAADPLLAANLDRSIPNLSSIVLHLEADGKTMLLTGDGRSDHLLQGLEQTGLLDGSGGLHVNVLKLAHHGSDRDVTKRFFKTVTADTYVASANGRDGNPDLATLIWLVESAKEQDRKVRLVVTNETPSLKKIRSEYPPGEYGYTLTVMDKAKHWIDVDPA